MNITSNSIIVIDIDKFQMLSLDRHVTALLRSDHVIVPLCALQSIPGVPDIHRTMGSNN